MRGLYVSCFLDQPSTLHGFDGHHLTDWLAQGPLKGVPLLAPLPTSKGQARDEAFQMKPFVTSQGVAG